MGKIKKILENELAGGTQTTDIYPVTSIKAVYDENNKRLDEILSASTEAINGVTNKVTELESEVDNLNAQLTGDLQAIFSDGFYQEDLTFQNISSWEKAIFNIKGLSSIKITCNIYSAAYCSIVDDENDILWQSNSAMDGYEVDLTQLSGASKLYFSNIKRSSRRVLNTTATNERVNSLENRASTVEQLIRDNVIEDITPSVLQKGFYQEDLTLSPSSVWQAAKIDISSYDNIRFAAAIRSHAKIIITDSSNNILSLFSGDGTSQEYFIPVKADMKWLYVSNEKSVIPALKIYANIKLEKRQPNYLYGKKIVVLGDSEAAGHTLPSNQTYAYLIAKRNDMQLTNNAENGSLLSSSSGLASTYQQKIGQDAEIVLIHIGYNDAWDDTVSDDSTDINTFKGAFNTLISGIQQNYPNIIINVLTPYYFDGNDTRIARAGWMVKRCNHFHVKCMDSTPATGLRRDISSMNPFFDNSTELSSMVHLSASGMERVSYIYEQFLRESIGGSAGNNSLESEIVKLKTEVTGVKNLVTTSESAAFNINGYINRSGNIVDNTAWKHTKIYEVDKFTEAKGLLIHGSVSNIAFYSSNEVTSANFLGYISKKDITKAEFEAAMPEGAKFFNASTDTTNTKYPYELIVTTNNLTVLEVEVEDLSEQVGSLSSDVSDTKETVENLNTQVNGNEGLVALNLSTGFYFNDLSVELHGNFRKAIVDISNALSIKVIASVRSNACLVITNSSDTVLWWSNQDLSQDYSRIIDLTQFNGATKLYLSNEISKVANPSVEILSSRSVVNSIKNNAESIEDLRGKISGFSFSNSLHFSFDDTIGALYDLVLRNRASLFDNPFFAELKRLHNLYGCVFSCYCFLDLIDVKYVTSFANIANPSLTTLYCLSTTEGTHTPGWYAYIDSEWVPYTQDMRSNYVKFSLSQMPTTYVNEFKENANWLKFGLHCSDGISNYNDATAEKALTDYNNLVTQVIRFTGTPKCIDMVPRLHNFAGNLISCQTMRDANCGALGFLASDYSETGGRDGGYSNGYYLSSPATTILWNKGHWYDSQERLHFYPSSLRIDAITGANMPAYMAKFLTANKWGMTGMIIMYGHENQMFNYATGTISSDYVTKLTAIAVWAKANGFTFGFPMDRIRASY